MFKYTQNNTTDTCVAIAFARPVEFKNPVKNIKLVLQDLKKANIPVFTIELLFDGQTNVIDNPTKTVYSDTRIVSKENLWNILEKEIPEQYSKIIFLDADIRFTNPDWFNLSSSLLEDNDLIQTHSDIYLNIDIDTDYSPKDIQRLIQLSAEKCSIAKGIKHKLIFDNNIHDCWVGFSVGIKRTFFKKIGGFYEKAMIGQGDTLFWECFSFTKFSLPVRQAIRLLPSYQDYYNKNINFTDVKIDYVEDCIACHLFHGIKSKRKYEYRYLKQPEEKYLVKNEYNVYELNNKLLLDKHLAFLQEREEDEEVSSYITAQLIQLAQERPEELIEVIKISENPSIYKNLVKFYVKCKICIKEYWKYLKKYNEKS